jgi:SAM-dependent methyltransferase
MDTLDRSAVLRIASRILHPHGQIAFLSNLENEVRLLDVGCGNRSCITKAVKPSCIYTCVDIMEYDPKFHCTDHYIHALPLEFSDRLLALDNQYDAVISSHNLEHCFDRYKTLEAMLKLVRQGGMLYLSFPSEKTVNFPKRRGTLNYYDDSTHQGVPPEYYKIVQKIERSGYKILFSTPSDKPKFSWVVGLLMEPYSRIRKRVTIGTWQYYGFEAIIIAKKLT